MQRYLNMWDPTKFITHDEIEDIVKVRYFAGDYTLTTKNEELKINTQFLNPDYFELLKTEIDKIEAA